MVVDAVAFEPVFAVPFPAIRENNSEDWPENASGRLASDGLVQSSNEFGENALRRDQGMFRALTAYGSR